MADQKGPPPPPARSGKAEPGFADRREYFENLSKATTDAASEIEFLGTKIDMLRNDPNLSADERDQAVSELQKRIDSLRNSIP